MENEDTILRVEHLGVTFGDRAALRDITFSVRKGDVLAIVGPNGSGKSVLVRALLDLLPHQGTAHWYHSPKISYIPQKLSIEKDLPLSVGEFLQFKESRREIIITALGWVGITDEHHIESHLLRQRLGTLSGGQLQRVLIAWSLLDEPDVLLYDEPTSGIDVGGEETIYNLLAKLREKRSLTLLIISHDLNIVYKYANNVICINRDMICHGVPSEVLDPKALAQLYGGQTGFYQHQHAHHS